MFASNTVFIMLNHILTYKEFSEIIEHCKKCKSGFAIKEFLEDIIKMFGNTNTNLCLSLMEFIEYHYQPLQGINELYEREVLRFEEDLPRLKNRKIEYAYSYLNYLYTQSDLIPQLRKSNDHIVFKTIRTPAKMQKILTALKKEEFCTFSDIKNISWIFNGTKPKQNSEKLTWTDEATRSKDVNFQTLMTLLKEIVVDSEAIISTRITFRNAFINSFQTIDHPSLDHNNVKSIINRFHKRHLKTENKREKLLLEIIK